MLSVACHLVDEPCLAGTAPLESLVADYAFARFFIHEVLLDGRELTLKFSSGRIDVISGDPGDLIHVMETILRPLDPGATC